VGFFGGGGGVILDLDKYIFPWQTCFIWGGVRRAHHRIESSCIQEKMVTSHMLEYVSGMTAFNSQTNLKPGEQFIKYCSQIL